ncbi:polymer-forming cytoskeletal protein [Vibrio alfacsensis]|uniref:polymer-forming cytoskeletal protein n=1 Tax=Vibrio alfacsensis TaxID=1074311 RepID=UPI001BF12E6C|nr:polymer-forming cytoskeletal protein [Vibrio alfacsensis]BCN26309.1 hypothetical protein VYA_35010 [Vibrio alfacsensis]
MLKRILLVSLSLLHGAAFAKDYNLDDLSTLNQICDDSVFTVQGNDYICASTVSIPTGATIKNGANSIPGPTIVAYGDITLLGNNTVGEPSNPINIKTQGSGLEIHVQENERISTIYGNLQSHGLLTMRNTHVLGNIESKGGSVHLKGNQNYVFGSVEALRKVELENAQIKGDVYAGSSSSGTSDSALLAVNSVIDGNLDSLGTIRLNQSQVCGNLDSTGQHIFTEGTNNLIVGHVKAFQKIGIKNTALFNQLVSTPSVKGNQVSIDANTQMFAAKLAIDSFQKANVLNANVCGSIKSAVAITDYVNNYCGFDDPNCDYSNQQPSVCPMPESIPQCEIKPPSEDDFELVVTPHDDIALMCGESLPQFLATTTNNGEPTSTKVTVTLSHPSLFTLKVIKGAKNGSDYLSTDEGQLELEIIPKDIDQLELGVNYRLTFTVADDADKAQAVKFMFEPFMFEAYSKDPGTSVDEISVVAGKSQIVNTRLLACSATGEQIVATNYDGLPKVNHSIIKPAQGSKGNFAYSADFTDGLSSHGLITNESGLFNVRLNDSFDCKGYENCPTNGTVTVRGSFDVKSRPWTLAICDAGQPLRSGTSSSGNGFIASGEDFSVTVKPIVWQSGGSLSNPVNTRNYCNAAVTRNFMLDDAPAASVVLSSTQATPETTSSGQTKLLESPLGLTKANKEHSGDGYVFSQLSWQEVGSLRVKTNLSGDYLDQTVNEGFRNIGRFYPKYFKARDVEWAYPSGQSFVYMNQPMDSITYDVIALNADKQNVLNYVHFAPNYRQHFNLGELSSYSDRFIPPRSSQGEWSKIGNASVGRFTIIKAASGATCLNSPCWEKDETDGQYPDGPFNKTNSAATSKIGLTYELGNVVDEVHFLDATHIFSTQPDVRFGRLNFKDVGGNQGMTIRVPLDVEVWEGGRFVTHFSDSSTTTDGEHHDRAAVWSNSAPDNTQLSGSGKMLAGRSTAIVASQKDSAREQVRFQLDLSKAGNNLPWLQYNWDKADSDEENPPAVVTFGIHRGNDRVIYRGEANMIGIN